MRRPPARRPPGRARGPPAAGAAGYLGGQRQDRSEARFRLYQRRFFTGQSASLSVFKLHELSLFVHSTFHILSFLHSERLKCAIFLDFEGPKGRVARHASHQVSGVRFFLWFSRGFAKKVPKERCLSLLYKNLLAEP